ncbi:MAG: thioredoxin-dependent thiol peroxidase [Alphaproteobacteria bacterium]|nr:thioredoxin-dependent thiol peroxidase [Alphaproteobacteria bacterium]
MNMLEEGQKAPAFQLKTDGGGEISLAELKGKVVVVYFYPKDDTPGCTTEAIAFSALKPEFDKCGAVLVGVSKDSVQRHDKFKEKHDLKIQLASDEQGEMVADYGVWIMKKNYGREYMGIDRSTFVIDAKGVIRNIWRKVKVKGHAEKVLEAVQAL